MATPSPETASDQCSVLVVNLATIRVSPDALSLCKHEHRLPRFCCFQHGVLNFTLSISDCQVKFRRGCESGEIHDKKVSSESVNEEEAILVQTHTTKERN